MSDSSEDAATEIALGRTYGSRTLNALVEILRLTDVAARLVDRGREWFDADPERVPGLACESLVIKLGENATRLDQAFLTAHPEVPWRVVKDMRNRLAHYYEATDYDVVWTTLAIDFPQVAAHVRAYLGR